MSEKKEKKNWIEWEGFFTPTNWPEAFSRAFFYTAVVAIVYIIYSHK